MSLRDSEELLFERSVIRRAGRECKVITGGGTGTFMFEGASKLWAEFQCGSSIFMDGECTTIEGRDGMRYAEFEHSLATIAVANMQAGSHRRTPAIRRST
ncbi:hypothetical protein PQQ82_19750 [Paraburkholderia sediminicola]